MLRKPDLNGSNLSFLQLRNLFLDSRRMSKPTTEPHFEAYAETGLHDLTHRLIGEVGSHWGEQQRPQHL